MTRDEIIAQNPINRVAATYGIALKKTGTDFFGLCPFHKEKTPSFSINPDGTLFHCFGCHKGGSVIDFVAAMDKIKVGEAMRKLGGNLSSSNFSPTTRRAPLPLSQPTPVPKIDPDPSCSPKEVASYSYCDALGVELFQVVRYEPKTFRQRHLVNGVWVWSLEGVNRVLYNLPAVLKASASNIWVVEGEKDCDNLKKLGIIATCNVGGAGKWLDGYSEVFKGKEVVLCGDNDPPGEDHIAKVLAAIAHIAKTVRVIRIPPPHKDVSDLIASFEGNLEAASRLLLEMVEEATVLTAGIELPIQTMEELEHQYRRSTFDANTTMFDCGSWIEALRRHIRPMVPGEVILILAATGVGKTAALQNIAVAAAPLSVLLFELELPGTLTFERFAALSTHTPASDIFDAYKNGEGVDWRSTGKLDHIVVCSKSNLSPEMIEKIILQAELKTGKRPNLVLIDYHQLLAGEGNTRYERASYAAEKIKILAKSTKTIIVISSQVGRKGPDDSPEVHLTDGKESGSLENSSGLVLGLWRDKKNPEVMHIRVLKNTKGQSGALVDCNFDGRTMVMSNRSPIGPEDIPGPPRREREALSQAEVSFDSVNHKNQGMK